MKLGTASTKFGWLPCKLCFRQEKVPLYLTAVSNTCNKCQQFFQISLLFSICALRRCCFILYFPNPGNSVQVHVCLHCLIETKLISLLIHPSRTNVIQRNLTWKNLICYLAQVQKSLLKRETLNIFLLQNKQKARRCKGCNGINWKMFIVFLHSRCQTE